MKKPANHKEKIKLTDTIQDVLFIMSEGNPGALVFFLGIVKDKLYDKIDPQSAFGGLGVLMDFDRMGIYGTHAYILFNDVCNRSLSTLATLLRAVQLGLLSEDVLYDISHRQDRSGAEIMNAERIQGLYTQVRGKLAEFNNEEDPRSLVPDQELWKTISDEKLLGKMATYNPTKPMADLDLPLNIIGIIHEINNKEDKKVFVIREPNSKIDSHVNEDEIVTITI